MPNLAFAETGTSSVDVDGTTFEVSYDATGLTIDDMEADTATGTLTIFITTTDIVASLEITLERSFFDSQIDGEDVEFVVLADGFDTPFEETATDTARTLTIDVPEGTNSLDIISFGATSFGSVEMPEEVPDEEQVEETPTDAPEETTEESEMQCGPGTILQNGVCVLETEEQVEEMPTDAPEETTEESEMQCGPGTILQDGVCVLDERCGPGTIFKDGQCVLEEAPQPSGTSRSGAFQMIYGLVAAFVIAFIIMIILWAIGRASRKNN
jgi:hypothetical protein